MGVVLVEGKAQPQPEPEQKVEDPCSLKAIDFIVKATGSFTPPNTNTEKSS